MPFPASIANSKNKDVTPTDKETLNFDDDISKGEDSCYPPPASMTSTENKAITENVVKPAGEKTWKCDDDTLKGEDSCFFPSFTVYLCVYFLMVCLLVFLYFFFD